MPSSISVVLLVVVVISAFVTIGKKGGVKTSGKSVFSTGSIISGFKDRLGSTFTTSLFAVLLLVGSVFVYEPIETSAFVKTYWQMFGLLFITVAAFFVVKEESEYCCGDWSLTHIIAYMAMLVAGVLFLVRLYNITAQSGV